MSQRGLTLLEVAVVCGVIALASAWVLPRHRLSGAREVSLAARRLADAVSLARDRAIMRQHPTAVAFDLDRQEWTADEQPRVPLPPGIRLTAITHGWRAPATRGRLVLPLSPTGDPLPTRIVLDDGRGHRATVLLPPARGRARVLEQARS